MSYIFRRLLVATSLLVSLPSLSAVAEGDVNLALKEYSVDNMEQSDRARRVLISLSQAQLKEVSHLLASDVSALREAAQYAESRCNPPYKLKCSLSDWDTVQLFPDDTRAFCASKDTCSVIDIATQKVLWDLAIKSDPSFNGTLPALAGDGSFALVEIGEGSIEFVNLETRAIERRKLEGDLITLPNRIQRVTSCAGAVFVLATVDGACGLFVDLTGTRTRELRLAPIFKDVALCSVYCGDRQWNLLFSNGHLISRDAKTLKLLTSPDFQPVAPADRDFAFNCGLLKATYVVNAASGRFERMSSESNEIEESVETGRRWLKTATKDGVLTCALNGDHLEVINMSSVRSVWSIALNGCEVALLSPSGKSLLVRIKESWLIYQQ